MDDRIFYAVFFVGLMGSVWSLPRNCRYARRERKVECKLAPLSQNMNKLNIPWEVKIVSLQNNKLSSATQIEEKISHLQQLVKLDVSYNDIANGLRDLVSKNTNLEEFRIRNNLLRSIDERVFENNPKLETVDLSNNLLAIVPRRLFQSNPRLRMALLWANDLKIVPEDLFRNNIQLEEINLSWNKLTDIPETFFRGLTNLKKVIVWKNQLTCLYSSMFQDNTLLVTFHAGINYLRKVPDQIFENNPELQDVRLWANRLECIPKRIFQNNDKVRYVNLLLGNEQLPWALRQRFSKTGLHNVFKMANELHAHGSETCTAAPCEWNPETFTMDCSDRGLTDLSGLADVCEKVRNLNLDRNFLNDPGVLEPAMDNLRELRTVSAKDNDMNGPIHPKTFQNNRQLSSLDLSQNKITVVPTATFKTNAILKNLNLADNDIETIEDGLLTNIPELATLDVSRNKIQKLSKTVFSRSKMMVVAKLSNNRISQIDEDTFKNNEKLREIDLSENQITGELLVDILEAAPDLETVRLQGNRITHFKKAGKQYKTQNRTFALELSYNRLENFPVELIQEKLYLRRLIMDHNKIETIPERALHKNKGLVEIDLSYNRLTRLSTTTFSQNSKLEILRLDHNALTRLDEGLLDGNPYLKYFSANGNKIHYVSPKLFFFNIHLDEVRLSDNVIASLPEPLFQPCGDSLRFVTLSRNYIDYLPRNIFVTNSNLEHVCLHGNTLSKLPKTPLLPQDFEDGSTAPGGGGVNDALRGVDKEYEDLIENNQDNYVEEVQIERLRASLRRVRETKDEEM